MFGLGRDNNQQNAEEVATEAAAAPQMMDLCFTYERLPRMHTHTHMHKSTYTLARVR